MDSVKLCCVLVLLVVGLARLPALVWGGNGVRRCDFPAIYNFGDSNSDTGGISSAALKEVPTPNGETFFGHPSGGRFCDGRLIIDLLGAEVAIPDCAYMDSFGTNFWHGANFATGGSSILPGGYSPFHLGIQISQFRQFKSRTTALYSQLSPNSNLDQLGCVKHWNEVAQEFNRQLKDRMFQLRAQLPNATFTYVDVHSAKSALISNAKNEGFVDPFEFCCGRFYGYRHIMCGKKATVNGTIYGNPCDNPSMHINWDGIHYSEAANLWIAKRILNNSLSSQ